MKNVLLMYKPASAAKKSGRGGKKLAPPGNRTRVARMGILHDTTTPAVRTETAANPISQIIGMKSVRDGARGVCVCVCVIWRRYRFLRLYNGAGQIKETGNHTLRSNLHYSYVFCHLKRFVSSPKHPDRLWAHAASCSMGIGVHSQEESGRDVKLSTHLHLVAKLGICWGLPLRPYMPSWYGKETFTKSRTATPLVACANATSRKRAKYVCGPRCYHPCDKMTNAMWGAFF